MLQHSDSLGKAEPRVNSNSLPPTVSRQNLPKHPLLESARQSCHEVDKTLVNDAENVELLSDRVSSERIVRFSTRKRREMALTGLIGSCLYRFPSNVDRERKKSMLRRIKQFEALHVGKHTSFGLGKITLLQDGENKGGMHEKGTGN